MKAKTIKKITSQLLALIMCILCIIANVTYVNASDKIEFSNVSGSKTKTMMVYMIGSNLETDSALAVDDLLEMLDTNNGDDFNIIVQTGGTKDWHGEAFTKDPFQDGEVQRFRIKNKRLYTLENLGKKSMVDPQTLTDFIQYSKANYPAEEYILVMWDHGGSFPISFGVDEIFPGEMLDCMEIGQAIADSGVHFDSLIFNACEMCSLELFMALRKNVDYVVAAESVVYGSGSFGTHIDYKDWITYAIENKAATQYYCERILDGYIDSLEENGIAGSMSVIRMDQIADVYKAYTKYMGEALKDITSKTKDANGNREGDIKYEEYVRVRENLASYQGTDAIDLSSLAGDFENKYSTKLQNAITNAVVRTKSEIAGGCGITVYSPYQYAPYYGYGRMAFSGLGYDKDITNFYDTFVSKYLYYSGYDASKLSWYVDPTKDGATITEGNGLNHEISYQDMGGYTAIVLSEEDWSKIKSVKVDFVMNRTNDEYYLGDDYQHVVDSNGYIKVEPPTSWMFVNNVNPTIRCIQNITAESGWAKEYVALCKVNGQLGYISIVRTSSEPDGVIRGYYERLDDSGVYTDGHIFVGDEKVVLCAITANQGGEPKLVELSTVNAYDLSCSFPKIRYSSGEKYQMSYTITDVYDNVYTTPYISITE